MSMSRLGFIDFQRQLAVLNESREPNLRLLERARRGNPLPFRQGDGRAVNRRAVPLETVEAPGEPIPPGIVNQAKPTAEQA